MATFSFHLDDASVEALFGLVDTTSASSVYAPWLDVGSVEISSTSFALRAPIGDGYFRLTNEWGETPQQFLNFHRLTLDRSTVASDAESLGDGVLRSTSVVRHWEGEDTRLAAVSVLERREVVDDEEVAYDKGLLFESVSGRQYALFAEGIAGLLRLTSSPAHLLRLTNATSVRAHRRRVDVRRDTIG